MATKSLADIFAERDELLKQTQDAKFSHLDTVVTDQPDRIQIVLKPVAKSWEELEVILKQVVNLQGMWNTVRELYDQGKGVELEAAAEIALARNRQTPFQYFCGMVAKKHGNWEKHTLKTIEETWKVRQNALRVIEQLKLEAAATGFVLGLCWKFKDSIIRFLGLATEQGYNIKNPAGYFFGIIKNVTAGT